jgi:uncharacterized protein YbaR (Trm112 family)
MDKYYPLELIELDIKEIKENNFNNKSLSEDDKKNKDIQKRLENSSKADVDIDYLVIINEGILYCKKCSRFYPIIDEIPILLPDELREKEKEIEFLNKWKNNIPQQILHNAHPWHL